MLADPNSITVTSTAGVNNSAGQGKIKYIASLDGLRAIAVMLLLVVHGSYGYFSGGLPRVDLFYIMSGFLITYLLYYEFNSTGTISIGKFYARRAWRIIPPLIICLILSNILWPFSKLPAGNDQMVATVSSLFFFNNIVFDYTLGNIAHLWSLSVEEHFYLIWPLVTFFILFRLTDRHRIVFLSLLIVAVEIFRLAAFAYEDEWQSGIFRIDPYTFTICRIDCILIGALMFFVLYRKEYNYGAPAISSYDNLLLVGLAVVAMISGVTVSLMDPRWLNGGFMVTNILCGVAVLIGIKNPNHPILTHKILMWLGRRSYGIYLYHFPIFFYTETFRVPHSFMNLFVVTFVRVATSIAFAALSYRYLELPLLEYKKKFKSVPTLVAERV